MNSNDKDLKKQLKESFLNKTIIVIVIIFVVMVISFVLIPKAFEEFGVLFLLAAFLILLFVIGFFRGLGSRKYQNELALGNLKYNPVRISRDKFIEECKSGLMPSYIRVNGAIILIATQFGEGDVDYVCYIDDKEIKGLDEFLSTVLIEGGTTALGDLNEIEFLECNGGDPQTYLIDHVA